MPGGDDDPVRPRARDQRPHLRLGRGIVRDNQHRVSDLRQHRPVQPRPLLGPVRDVLTRHPQRPQQRVQRLTGLHRILVVAVQVDEQHPARKPAR